jgi:hypothetical protein
MGAGIGSGMVIGGGLQRGSESDLGFWGSWAVGIVAAMLAGLVVASIVQRFIRPKKQAAESDGGD